MWDDYKRQNVLCKGLVTIEREDILFPLWFYRITAPEEEINPLFVETIVERGRQVQYQLSVVFVLDDSILHYTGKIRTLDGCWVHYDDTVNGTAAVVLDMDMDRILPISERENVCSLVYERLADEDCQRWASVWRYRVNALCGLCAGVITILGETLPKCENCGLTYHTGCWTATRRVSGVSPDMCTHCSMNRFRIQCLLSQERRIGFIHCLKWHEIHPQFILFANRSRSIRFVPLIELKTNFTENSAVILRDLRERLGCKKLSDCPEVQAICRDILISGMKTPVQLSYTMTETGLRMDSGYAEFAAAVLLGMTYVPVRVRKTTPDRPNSGFVLLTPNAYPAGGTMHEAARAGKGEHRHDIFIEVHNFAFTTMTLDEANGNYAGIIQTTISETAMEWRHRCITKITTEMNVIPST